MRLIAADMAEALLPRRRGNAALDSGMASQQRPEAAVDHLVIVYDECGSDWQPCHKPRTCRPGAVGERSWTPPSSVAAHRSGLPHATCAAVQTEQRAGSHGIGVLGTPVAA